MAWYSSSRSFWEKDSFYAQRDVIIIGAGLSGLWAAYHLKKLRPSLSITILERGLIPSGASTRNAGFACFGSLTELLNDIRTMGAEKMAELVSMRYRGLQQIVKTFETDSIAFSLCGGYELIMDGESDIAAGQIEAIPALNKVLADAIGLTDLFRVADQKKEQFGLANVRHLIENKTEGYLHPGKLCQALAQKVLASGVTILNGVNVNAYSRSGDRVFVNTSEGYDLSASNLLICTNAFAGQLIPGINLKPARGQVLLTNEIADLKLNGAFHADEGYYYFRNVGNRVLLGGARNTDFSGETSHEMQTTDRIQEKLEQFLSTYILPGRTFSISDRWSGIMAMGDEKLPIVRQIEPNVYCSVRMSGMGVALTPVTGEMIASQILELERK